MLTHMYMTFEEMIDRFGEISAWQILAEIERGAGISPRFEIADPEVRLVYAYRLQDTKAADTSHQRTQSVAA